MKRKKTSLWTGTVCATALLAFLALLPSCNSNAADDTAFEPTRDMRLHDLAEAACERYGDTEAGCPGFGTAEVRRYESEQDCTEDFSFSGSALWPNERCGQDQIDNARFEACVGRASTFPCSNDLGTIYSVVSSIEECNVDMVCTDPPS